MKKVFTAMLVIVLLLGSDVSTYAFSNATNVKLKGAIGLYLNQPKAYVDAEAKKIDPKNAKVCPVISQNKTLLPLRFMAESLKAEVKWEAKTKTAVISLNDKTVKITAGSTKMFINGKERKLDVPAKVIEGRSLIPARAVAEAFDKKVFWNNRGLVIISEKEKPLDNEKEIIEVMLGQYDYVGDFHDGLAEVKKDDKWGFIDEAGKEIIKLRYDDAYSFNQGLAVVKRDDKWGFIDKTGKEIIELKYDAADSFSEDLAVVKRNDKWGYIDRTGKEVIEIKYDDAYSFSEGLAEATKDGKWGYIDKIGKEVINFKYDDAYSFSKGLALVERDDKWGFIDKTGKEIIELKYDTAYSFSEDLAVVVKDSKWGFINKAGKEVLELKYDEAYSFSGGLAVVKKDGRTFSINKEGEEVSSTSNNTIQSNDLEKEEKSMINIKTDKGDIQLALYPELMPITTENFLNLVNEGFYNGLNFHRVEDWVIQGGDPNGNGTGGSEKTIKLEINSKLKNIRGAIAMARTSEPDSASSQFYILKKDASWLDGSYAVFGNVITGMDIVDNMAANDKIIKVEELK